METLEELLESREGTYNLLMYLFSIYQLRMALHPENKESLNAELDDIGNSMLMDLLDYEYELKDMGKVDSEEEERIMDEKHQKLVQKVDAVVKDSRALAEYIFDEALYGTEEAEMMFWRRLSGGKIAGRITRW